MKLRILIIIALLLIGCKEKPNVVTCPFTGETYKITEKGYEILEKVPEN